MGGMVRLVWLRWCLLVLLLCGCSMRKVGYHFADRYLSGRLADTFALEEMEKTQTHRIVRNLHVWHRKKELPRYAGLLDGLGARLSDGMTQEDFSWLRVEGNQAVARLGAQFAPLAATFLLQRRPDQLEHATRKMSEAEAERFEKLDAPEKEYFAYRKARTKKLLKTWLGSYTDEQLQLFCAFHEQDRHMEFARRKAQQENRQKLLWAVQQKQPPQAIETLILHWLTQRQTHPTPDYQQTERQQEEKYVQLLLLVDRTLSAKQRHHLMTELAAWKRDFIELAAE